MLENPEKTKDAVVRWIRDYVHGVGSNMWAVVGISGGKDSSVTAALCAEALGKNKVLGVLMPDGVQSDISDAEELVTFLGIPHITVNIAQATSAIKSAFSSNTDFCSISGNSGLSHDSCINLPPRIRMATLYAAAQSLPGGGLVANTCNLSEDYVGYSTKFGDSAGDFSPLGNLLVEEVRQLGRALGLPSHLIEKTPSDGLSGMSDEDKLGFTYALLGDYILTGSCPDQETKAKIDRLHKANLHKLQGLPKFEK